MAVRFGVAFIDIERLDFDIRKGRNFGIGSNFGSRQLIWFYQDLLLGLPVFSIHCFEGKNLAKY